VPRLQARRFEIRKKKCRVSIGRYLRENAHPFGRGFIYLIYFNKALPIRFRLNCRVFPLLRCEPVSLGIIFLFPFYLI
jgi:hypothetical protein